MWLVIRWILIPWAVGRRIHPSIGEFNDPSKDFRKRALGPWAAPLGAGDPRPLPKILRRIVEVAN